MLNKINYFNIAKIEHEQKEWQDYQFIRSEKYKFWGKK